MPLLPHIGSLLARLDQRPELPYRNRLTQGELSMFRRQDFATVIPKDIPAVRYVRTAGNTADTMYWGRSPADLDREVSLWSEVMATFGVGRNMRGVVALPNGDIAQAMSRAGEILGCGMLVVGEYDIPDAIEMLRPEVVAVSPLVAMRLHLRNLLGSVRCLILTSDVSGTGALQRQLTEYYPDMLTREVYTLTEHAGPLAVGCDHGALHWTADGVAVELIHPGRGDEARVGEVANVVLTDLGERAMPLLRYNTEDLVRVMAGPCACGNDSPVLSSLLLGRLGRTRALSGRVIFPADLAAILFSMSTIMDRFKAVVRSDRGLDRDQLDIQVALMPGADEHRVRHLLLERVLDRTGIVANIIISRPTAIEPVLQVYVQEFRAVAPDPVPYMSSV